jgi:hypothetical protein
VVSKNPKIMKVVASAPKHSIPVAPQSSATQNVVQAPQTISASSPPLISTFSFIQSCKDIKNGII